MYIVQIRIHKSDKCFFFHVKGLMLNSNLKTPWLTKLNIEATLHLKTETKRDDMIHIIIIIIIDINSKSHQ